MDSRLDAATRQQLLHYHASIEGLILQTRLLKLRPLPKPLRPMLRDWQWLLARQQQQLRNIAPPIPAARYPFLLLGTVRGLFLSPMQLPSAWVSACQQQIEAINRIVGEIAGADYLHSLQVLLKQHRQELQQFHHRAAAAPDTKTAE